MTVNYGLGSVKSHSLQESVLPSVSIVIPTYNSERLLEECINSILQQDYPRSKIQIIIADGGSKDKTVIIAQQLGADVILDNPLRTAEAGKSVGAKAAKNDLVAFIDSDNILPTNNWLKSMVWPFINNQYISASEPLYYTFRKEDPILTRYCSLLGMNDPFCLFMGNYDRYSILTKRWTDLPVQYTDIGDYYEIILNDQNIPTIGANGFIVRRQLVINNLSDYLFDIDLVHSLMVQGHNRIAKVKVGIIHLYGKNGSDFIRKQRRRINDFLYFQRKGLRSYPWLKKRNRIKIIKFIIYTLTIVPLLVQMMKGYSRFPDSSWRFHIWACWITMLVYAKGMITKVNDENELMKTRSS